MVVVRLDSDPLLVREVAFSVYSSTSVDLTPKRLQVVSVCHFNSCSNFTRDNHVIDVKKQ